MWAFGSEVVEVPATTMNLVEGLLKGHLISPRRRRRASARVEVGDL